MRSKTKLFLLISSSVIIAGMALLTAGCLSTPRDFASPQATIRLVDENGSPLTGIEVGRNWRDNDRNKDGSDVTSTDNFGLAQFSKVPATVGVFTGAGMKLMGFFSACGSGSGADTTIYVRFHGLCKVIPKGKPLHAEGQSEQDPDGVWFDVSTDSQTNTVVSLKFPQKTKLIDYVLSSESHDTTLNSSEPKN